MNTKHEEMESILRQFKQLSDDHDLVPWLRDRFTSFLSSERADWLRSEIEKLEGEFKEVSDIELLPEDGYNTALTSIITRYKEELLELEK